MASILVVDDNLMEGRHLAQALRQAGHEAAHVYTLAQGLERVQEGGWNAVLLDATLPDGDGVEAVPGFRGAPGHPGVVLLLAEGAEDAGGQHAAALSKPLDQDALEPALQKALDQGGKKPKAPGAAMGRKKAKPGARAGKAAARDASLAPLRSKDLPSLKAFRERMDREYLQALLQATEGDVAKALEIADISRAGYYNLLKKHGLTGSQS